MIAIALLLQVSAAPVPRITHEQIEANHYRLRMVAPGISDVQVAQVQLLPTAVSLCGDRPPHFGHFEWVANEQMAPGATEATPRALALIQELYCGSQPPAPPETAAPPDPNWQRSDAQEQQVLARTRAYFAAKDSGRYAEAYAMLTPTMQADSDLQTWSQAASAFNSRAGEARGRQLIRVTWYNNPPQAPVPGLYAAVDFNGNFASLHFLCAMSSGCCRRTGHGGWSGRSRVPRRAPMRRTPTRRRSRESARNIAATEAAPAPTRLNALHPPFSGTLRNGKPFYIQDKASPDPPGGHLHEKA